MTSQNLIPNRRQAALRVVAMLLIGAGPILLPAAPGDDAAGDTKTKIREIRDLGRRDSQSIGALAAYLGDPADEVRLEAVKAIVGIGTQYSLDPLVRATRDQDAELQIRATDGLVNFYVPGFVAKGLGSSFTRTTRIVKGFFNDRNDQVIDPGIQVRDDVAQALGDLAGGSSAMEARANGALAAGVLRARLAVPGLRNALRSRDSDLIFEALVALQKIRDVSAGEAVILLLQDLDDKVQVTALETVGVLRTVSAAPNVRQALDRARSARIRRAALASLAMIASAQDHAAFLRYSAEHDAQLRAAAVEGLGRLRDPEDMSMLEETFNEQNLDERVRLAAAFAVVAEGKVETSEFSALRYLVNGLNLKAHGSIAQAYLTELLRVREVRQAIAPLMADGSSTRDEKIQLSQSLAQSGAADAVPLLERLAKDSDAEVSVAATRSLRVLRARLP